MPGISLSRVNATMRRVNEALAYGQSRKDEGAPPTIELHLVKITSTTKTSGRYPGKRYDRDANADTDTERETIWVDCHNSAVLLPNIFFWAKLSGQRSSDSVAIFDVLNPPPMLWGKLDGTLNYQSSATMSIWSGTGAGSDTGENVTVHDGVLSSGQSVATNKFIMAYWDSLSGIYRMGSAQCS